MNLYQRVWRLVKPHWKLLSAATACMLVVGANSAAMAWIVKPLLDDVFLIASSNPDRAKKMILLLPLAFVIIQFTKGAATYGQEVIMNRIGQSVIAQLRESIFAHLQRLSLSFYDKTETGTLIARVTHDVALVQEAVSRTVAGGFRDVFSIIALTFVVFYRDWQLALLAMAVFPFAMVPFVRFGRMVRQVAAKGQQSTADIANLLQETITGARVVKAFAAEDREISRFNALSQTLLRLTMREVRIKAVTSPVMELLGGAAVAGVIGYGGWQVIAGKSSAGNFFSFVAAVVLLYEPVKQITRANNVLQKGLSAAERVFDLLDTPPEIIDRPDAVELDPIQREIRFENVTFSYGREPVLDGIDLTVKAGQIVALAGSSGGGKTTLVNLLPRFYEIQGGSISIDGCDVRQATLASLRRQIALVTQQTILFNDTISANISYGRREADPDEIIAAAKAAYAHDFITSLPQGYDTVIGEQGVMLSGGQRQRLAIARALLKDAPILILDEATSSLDTESEHFVQKAIDNLMKGRTTLVIAHRLSTIQNADRIIVLADGRIAEEGNHGRLMDLKGEYYKLYQMQFND